jgi:hypothetical protein
MSTAPGSPRRAEGTLAGGTRGKAPDALTRRETDDDENDAASVVDEALAVPAAVGAAAAPRPLAPPARPGPADAPATVAAAATAAGPLSLIHRLSLLRPAHPPQPMYV